MSNNKETAQERLARMKREKDAAKGSSHTEEIVGHLTHEKTGEEDMAALAKKLIERKKDEKVTNTVPKVKYTIYINEDVAMAFDALCTKRGDQRKFANQALAEFVAKKAKELGL